MNKSQMILPSIALSAALLFNGCGDPQIEYVEVPCNDPSHGQTQGECPDCADHQPTRTCEAGNVYLCYKNLAEAYNEIGNDSFTACGNNNCKQPVVCADNVLGTFMYNIYNGDWYDGSGSMHAISSMHTNPFAVNPVITDARSGGRFAPCATSAEIQAAEDAARAQIGTMCTH